MRRVVITGMGVVSALGTSVPAFHQRLHVLKNAVRTLPDLEKYKGLNSHLGAPVENFRVPEHFTRKVTRTMGPVSILACVSAEEALTQAGLIGAEVLSSGRTGVAYGSSSGSVEPITDFYSMIATNEVKRITSSTYVKIMPQTCAVNLSLYFKTRGRLYPTGTACTSGSLAVGLGYEAIKFGLQDVMIVGGAEEFSPTQVAVFDTLYATSLKNDTPEETPAAFDAGRDGLVIGEGAGTLILEEYEHAKRRGAEIFAEVVGFGTTTDGKHITQPSSETMALALKGALADASLSPDAIGYCDAHGTATTHGDVAESAATFEVFGKSVPVSTQKSYIGHTLGACGAIEAIAAVSMHREGWFAPNLNLKNVDPACAPLDYIIGEGRELRTKYVMSNNFAFGGINTSLIFTSV